MRILVTGALGTLGKPLVQELRSRGHNVFEADTRHDSGAQYQRCDISEYRQVADLFDWALPDVVYHLAAEFGRMNGEDYYEQVWKTNAIGTKHVLRVAHAFAAKVVFASSSEVYGDLAPDGGLLQDTEHYALHQTNDYALSKWVNELQCLNEAARHGTEIMRLRFFNSYGPGEFYHPYRSVVCLFCYSALHGIPYDVYRGYYRVFMFIDDFIPTLANACERFHAGEVINVGGAEYRSVEELSGIVLRTLGLDPTSDLYVNWFDEDKHNVVAKRPDIEKARKLLGHNPKTKLEEGVAFTLDWMKEVYGVRFSRWQQASIAPATDSTLVADRRAALDK